jgi:DNA-binding NtrC family response regulator
VVLTDLFLPHGDGLALVQQIRHGSPHTHVVVMGAFSGPETQQHALAAGADTFLDKPFTLARLWEVVQPALEGLKSQDMHRWPRVPRQPSSHRCRR